MKEQLFRLLPFVRLDFGTALPTRTSLKNRLHLTAVFFHASLLFYVFFMIPVFCHVFLGYSCFMFDLPDSCKVFTDFIFNIPLDISSGCSVVRGARRGDSCSVQEYGFPHLRTDSERVALCWLSAC